MLQRLGIENPLQGLLFIALSLIVVITPLGREASNPIVLGLYRSLLFIIIIAALKLSTQRSDAAISPYFLASTATFIALLLASLLSEGGSLFEGKYVFYEHVLFLAAFIALASFQRTQSDRWKRSALFVVVCADLVFLLVAFIMPSRPILGPFVNPNYFASFLLPGIGICLAYALFGSSGRHRAAALAIVFVLYFGVIQAFSRGATLAAIVMIGAGIFRAARRRGISTGRLLLLGTAVGLVTVAVSPALVQKFMDRGERDPYNYQRPQIWLGTLKMIADHPVLGVGPGRYYYTSKLYTPAVEGTIARYRKWPNIAHSEYLQYMAESGIPAGLLMFAIGGFLFARLWRRADHLTGEPSVFQESALLTAIGLGVHALVDNNWTAPVLAVAMVVISQADVLPQSENSVRRRYRLNAAERAILALGCAAIFVQSTLVPTIALYFNEEGHRAYVAFEFDRAELMHQIAVGIAPDHPVLLDNLGTVYFDEFMKTRRTDYLEQAEWAFEASMAANPHFDIPGGHLETALIQRLTGNPRTDQFIHKQIVAADRHVLAANPYNPFIRRNLAEALYNTGAKTEATAELERAIAIEPNYVPGYLRLAEWTAESGHEIDSGEYRKRAIDLVTKYQDRVPEDSFEALLLGRTASIGQTQ